MEIYSSVVEAIFKHAEKKPDRLCVADTKKSYTYIQMKNIVEQTASKLFALGVSSGKCVVVECTQDTDYCIAQQAVQLLGAVFIPTDKKISETRLFEIMSETDAILFIGRKRKDLSVLTYSMSEIKELPENENFTYSFPKADDRAELLYTTGTTGKSKGIDLTHKNNIAIAQNILSGVEMKDGNVEIVPVSLSHSHGLRTMYANFVNGNSVVIVSGVTFLAPFFRMIEEYKVTAIDLVPSAWRNIYNLGADKLASFSGQIDYVQLGSEPLTENDEETLKKVLPQSRLYNFYGSTESGRTCTYNFAEYGDKFQCIGKPVCNATVLIVDRERRPLSESTREKPGFLAFSGAMNMTGYWKNKELTDSIMTDGVIYTNDLGYIDDEGWIYMMGREDDIINYGGTKINPEVIETVAMRFDGIADCACVAHSDPTTGQAPWLYVQLEEKSELTKADIGKYLQGNLDKDIIPKEIVFIDKIPRTYNGKLLRRELRNLK